MSKDIAIKEGNAGKYFRNVKKLRISGYPSGDTYWVPEDGTKLGTKHISKNGKYKASEEKDEQGVSKGLYGYSEVTVSGIGSGTYTAQNGDHLNGQDLEEDEDYNIKKDEQGNPVIDMLPAKIKVTKKPNKYEYIHGENIDITGIVVKGYTKKDTLWKDKEHPDSVLKIDELTFSPDKADMGYVSRTDYTDDDGINAALWKIGVENIDFEYDEQEYPASPHAFALPLWIRHYSSQDVNVDIPVYLTMAGYAEILVTQYNNELYVSLSNGDNYQKFGTFAYNSTYHNFYFIESATTARLSDKFREAFQPDVESESYSINPYVWMDYIPVSTKDPTGIGMDDLEEVGGKQKITMTYIREDGKELTDTWEATVEPANTPEQDPGGGGGGHEF